MKEIIIFNYSLYELIIYFFVYAFLGWISEMIFATLKTGKFTNRGFLLGPLCPIYGNGMIIAILLLQNFRDKWYLLFIVGAIVASLLELITGFILEKLFHTKWWDYSKEPFNLKGYICLRFSLIWGFGIVLMFETIVPLIELLVNKIPDVIGMIFIIACSVFYIADNIITLLDLLKYNTKIKELNELTLIMKKGSDTLGEAIYKSTMTIKEKMIEAEGKIRSSRLGKAFPTMVINIKNSIHKGENHEK